MLSYISTGGQVPALSMIVLCGLKVHKQCAVAQVRESSKFRRVMQTILSLGNALNQGTSRGEAVTCWKALGTLAWAWSCWLASLSNVARQD